jgi:hypothetical protein
VPGLKGGKILFVWIGPTAWFILREIMAESARPKEAPLAVLLFRDAAAIEFHLPFRKFVNSTHSV